MHLCREGVVTANGISHGHERSSVLPLTAFSVFSYLHIPFGGTMPWMLQVFLAVEVNQQSTDTVPRATSLCTISLRVSPRAVLKSKLAPRAARCRLLVYIVS